LRTLGHPLILTRFDTRRFAAGTKQRAADSIRILGGTFGHVNTG
jgi:hypothetical protein